MNIITTLGERKKNGTATVYNVVYINRNRVRLNTGIDVLIDKWDNEKVCLRGNTKDDADKTLIIQQSRAAINEIFIRYRLEKKILTEKLLKQEYKNPALRVDFYSFANSEITDRIKTNDIAASTGKQHYAGIRKLENYKKRLSFAEITPEFIEQYTRHMKKSGMKINSVNQKLKVVKTYISIAVRKRIITNDPFNAVRFRNAKTNRVYLTPDELNTLLKTYNNHELTDSLHRVLRHYLFMCYTGMRYSDVLHCARRTNLVSNMLVYLPYKTQRVKGEPIKLPLNQIALKLISDENNNSEYLFNLNAEQVMNRQLKQIATIAEINKNITTHTGRHTFATNFVAITKNIVVLQKLLGHSRITETMVYVHLNEGETEREMQLFNDVINQKTP